MLSKAQEKLLIGIIATLSLGTAVTLYRAYLVPDPPKITEQQHNRTQHRQNTDQTQYLNTRSKQALTPQYQAQRSSAPSQLQRQHYQQHSKQVININTATEQTLQLLPGIGPKTARKIIHHRIQNGPFSSISELQAIKGIGPKTLEKLSPLIRI